MRRCLLILMFVLAVRAQETPTPRDFLVLIDTSMSMANKKFAVLSAVRELIRNGFSGQMEAGDNLDIWTFGSKDRAGRPPTVWDPEEKDATSAWATDTIRSEQFHRGSRLAPLLEDLRSFLPRTKVALITVFTDADEQMSGFDLAQEINGQIARLRGTARRAKQPIAITLLALNGK